MSTVTVLGYPPKHPQFCSDRHCVRWDDGKYRAATFLRECVERWAPEVVRKVGGAEPQLVGPTRGSPCCRMYTPQVGVRVAARCGGQDRGREAPSPDPSALRRGFQEQRAASGFGIVTNGSGGTAP